MSKNLCGLLGWLVDEQMRIENALARPTCRVACRFEG
jgi:hypothetical protein